MLKEVLGSLISPWLYIAARAGRSEKLAGWAVEADPFNFRGVNLLKLDTTHRDIALRLRHLTLFSTRVPGPDAERLAAAQSCSRAQYHQDLFVLLASEGKRGGYFVEVGVGDGDYLSNSVMLEDDLDWTGLLCEPNRTFQASIERRRKAKLEKRAIYRTGGDILEFLADDAMGELSRLIDAEGSDDHKRSGQTYSVTTATLDQALDAAGAPAEIDYISIDTEGSEVAVLDGLDLSRWKIGVFTIEHNNDAGRREEYARRLAPHGFVRVLEAVSGIDDWYVNRAYAPAFLARLGL